jgi:GrpB-like predicted nucleotidyltransferase (UPF0157 family)
MNDIYKGIGLAQGEVKLVPIERAKWDGIFVHEKEFLAVELNKPLADETGDLKFEVGKNVKIVHSGGTAFDQTKAKPILDLIMGFSSKADLLRAKDRILGNNKGTVKLLMTPRAFGFYLLGKMDGDKVVAHYHLSIRGGREWKEQNDILYMLHKNWKIRKEYEQLREELSEKYKNSRLSYTRAKRDFLKAILFRKHLIDQRNLLNKYSRS